MKALLVLGFIISTAFSAQANECVISNYEQTLKKQIGSLIEHEMNVNQIAWNKSSLKVTRIADYADMYYNEFAKAVPRYSIQFKTLSSHIISVETIYGFYGNINGIALLKKASLNSQNVCVHPLLKINEDNIGFINLTSKMNMNIAASLQQIYESK